MLYFDGKSKDEALKERRRAAVEILQDELQGYIPTAKGKEAMQELLQAISLQMSRVISPYTNLEGIFILAVLMMYCDEVEKTIGKRGKAIAMQLKSSVDYSSVTFSDKDIKEIKNEL